MQNKQLYKGIFWIKDLEDMEKNKDTCFPYACDTNGQKTTEKALLSKSGENYNHKLVWNTLGKRITENKPFDYFPRGRVEISKGVVKIFLNPNINNEVIINFIINKFNLTTENGIKEIKILNDSSEHYKCYLDY